MYIIMYTIEAIWYTKTALNNMQYSIFVVYILTIFLKNMKTNYQSPDFFCQLWRNYCKVLTHAHVCYLFLVLCELFILE